MLITQTMIDTLFVITWYVFGDSVSVCVNVVCVNDHLDTCITIMWERAMK